MLGYLKHKFIAHDIMTINPAIRTKYDYSMGTTSNMGGASVFTPSSSKSDVFRNHVIQQISNLVEMGYSGVKEAVSLLSYPYIHPTTKEMLLQAIGGKMLQLNDKQNRKLLKLIEKKELLSKELINRLPMQYANEYKEVINDIKPKEQPKEINKFFEFGLFSYGMFNDVKKNVFLQIGFSNIATNARIQIGLKNQVMTYEPTVAFRLGLLNYAKGDMKGINIALLWNQTVYGKLSGFNLALLHNSGRDISRLNVAVFTNCAEPTDRVIAGELKGVSVSLYNFGQSTNGGLQLGLINNSQFLGGFSIGLLNKGGLSHYGNGGVSICTIGVINLSNDNPNEFVLGVINTGKGKIKFPVYYRR